MAATSARIWPVAPQLPAAGGTRRSARLPSAAGAAAGLRGGAYPAHVEGSDANEPATASCRLRHHRRDRYGDPPRDRGGRARSGRPGRAAGPAVSRVRGDRVSGADWQLPGRTRLRPDPGPGVIRLLSDEGDGLRQTDRSDPDAAEEGSAATRAQAS